MRVVDFKRQNGEQDKESVKCNRKKIRERDECIRKQRERETLIYLSNAGFRKNRGQ